MQLVTISGTLLDNASRKTDKNGRSFTRFTVTCGQTDINDRTIYTHYRCICYIPGYDKMKKGDQVFITGKLSAGIGIDEKNKAYLNMDVLVTTISKGYNAEERRK